MPSRTSLSRVVVLTLLAAAFAAAGCEITTSFLHPAPTLYERDFQFQRKDGSSIDVTEQKPLVLPHHFADFDLWSEIALPEGGEVDVVHRMVEPLLRENGLEPFHARFTVARLSAVRDGQAVRTREQALFDDDPDPTVRGGVMVGAGLPSTLTITARGRRLQMSVAGRRLPPIDTTDAHGEIAFLVRGGTALISKLEITAVPRPLHLLPVGWCAILGGLTGLLVGLFGQRSDRRTIAALLAIPAFALLAGWSVFRHELPETEPEILALVCGACAGIPSTIAMMVGARLRVVPVVIAILIGLLGLECAARVEQPRLRPLEDPRLTAYFGENSGSAPFDALARRISALDAVHGVVPVGERVVFLGGDGLYESDPDRAHWIAPIACARASKVLGGRKLDGAVLSTLWSHVRQQIDCFERFYRGPFAPVALVLTIPPWEGEPKVPAAAHEFLDSGALPAPSYSRLVDLISRSSRAPVVAGDPASLARETFAFIDRCRERHIVTLLAIDRGLDAAMTAEVVAEAKRRAMPLLRLSPIDDPATAIEEIGDGLADLLR